MNYNDYELLLLARENNEEAVNLLYEKYRPIIVKKSKEAILLAAHHGIEINDIIQESYIAFDEAVKNYNQDESATFYTFAMLCIDRRITNYIRKNTNKRSMVLNEAVAIDDKLENVLKDDTSVENTILSIDSNIDKISNLRQMLTTFERQVFDLKIKGYNFDEIARELGTNLKAIYNTWARIKNKYKKNIKIDD